MKSLNDLIWSNKDDENEDDEIIKEPIMTPFMMHSCCGCGQSNCFGMSCTVSTH